MSENKCSHCGHKNPIGTLVCEKCAIPLGDTPLKNKNPRPAKAVILPANARNQPATQHAEPEPKHKNRGVIFAVVAIFTIVLLAVIGISFVKNTVWPKIAEYLAEDESTVVVEDAAEPEVAMVEDEPEIANPDIDNDGIADAPDECPEQAETMNGYQDGDGCPDEVPDQDGDGFPDDRDNCPANAEDFDDYQDRDGCPDVDNDGDGICDNASMVDFAKSNGWTCTAPDLCPDEAENMNGFKDEDGCPDEIPVEESTSDPYCPTGDCPQTKPDEDPEPSQEAPVCNSVTLTDPDDTGLVWAILSDCTDKYTQRCAYTEENFNYATNQFVSCEQVAP